MTKAELRKKYKTLRKNLSQKQIDDLSIAIANQTLELPVWNVLNYHIFLTIEEHTEINTGYILSIITGKDKNAVISKSNFTNNSLTHFLLTDNTIIKKNSWGIPEPVDGIEMDDKKIDVVFVPLLAFDKTGHRVGYGKGFYDDFLAKCRPQTIKIGLSFFDAEDHIEDIYQGDIPLDYCITPNKIYKF